MAELDLARQSLLAETDSVIAGGLPIEEDVQTGVFLTWLGPGDLPVLGPVPWMYLSDFEKVVWASVPPIPPPAFLMVDRQTKTAVFNESVILRNVLVNDVRLDGVVLNRAGFIVPGREGHYLALLQFLSTEPADVLEKLEGVFSSIRLVR